MGTQVVEKIYTPLEPKAARTLVNEVNAMIEALAESDPDDDDDDDDDDDGSSLIDVLDDVFLEVDEAPPPSVDEARAAADEGDALEAALERLPACRSTLAIEYDAGVAGEAPFVALQKLLFERVGDAVVSREDGAVLVTVETAAAKRAKEVGKLWANTLPLGGSEPAKKPAAKARPAAKEAELDGETVYKRLSSVIEGRDPLAREMLKRELQNTTDAVRGYAGALMHEGAVPDPAIAKILSCSVEDVASAREALWALLKKVR